MEVNEASAHYVHATGYKQTEVGLIPEDWRVTSIDQISSVGRGRVISHKEISRSLSPKYPVYSSQTSNNGVMGYLDTFEFEGDYITWTTDGANAGTVFYRNGRFNCTNVCGTIKLKSDNHLFVAKMLGRFAPAHVSRHLGNPKLMNDVMKRIRIPLPPTKAEQEAIAEALSDADALIESLEQLLAKKRHLKQGAMQELLTGKKRLPGFSGEWDVKRLGELFDIFAGGDFDPSRSSIVQDERHPFPVYSNAITDSGLYGFCSYTVYSADTITVTARGTLGVANYRDHPYTAIGRVLVLQPKLDLDGRFFAAFINNRISFVIESTGVPQLTAPQISKYELPAPLRAEQTAIATIISDMDTELAVLDTKLTKARQIKQGMMQELLTGRIRLV